MGNFNGLAWLAPHHAEALAWFHERTGQEVGWPGPVNGIFLANKAKGIHKPAGLEYALSVRQSLNGPYDDALHLASDGSWYLRYHHEGSDPEYFTNRAMNACRVRGVPIGVLLQVKQKPNPVYKVLGLGLVSNDQDGMFTIQQYGPVVERVEVGVALQGLQETFNASNLADARRREMRAIAVRRGQPAFRRRVLDAYNGECAISGCRTSAVLEAAHIISYRGDYTNHVCNGILLRADLHTLFDLGLLRVRPKTYTVHIAEELVDSEYFELNGRQLLLPKDAHYWPDEGALREKFGEVVELGSRRG